MRALIGKPPILQHDNVVGIADRREPVRDDQCGPFFRGGLERGLNDLLAFRIQHARRLIQQKNRRIWE
ncbi:hypothetical protein [Hyphobacterium sp.]|uniref:hypothetical protein n=1 Tax=Hyphobacterium sp. TaxID=2004662 RepID=UPI0037496A79